MKLLIVVGLLCCIFIFGEALTCDQCVAIYSTNDEVLNISSIAKNSCTKPTQTDCKGNASCGTMIYKFNFMHKTEGLIVMTDFERGCNTGQYSQLIPSGDVCLDDASVEIIKADLPDPESVLPPVLRAMYLNSSLSFCVCDSEDLCTPPLPVAPTPPSPVVPMSEPSPEPGSAITCVTCMDITSESDVAIAADKGIPSCSDNPTSVTCPAGVSSCISVEVNASYSRDSGPNVMLTKEQRGCASLEGASLIPQGDACLDKASAEEYLKAADSLAVMSDGDDLTFESISGVTLCVCDGAENCMPPSPLADNTTPRDCDLVSSAAGLGASYAFAVASILNVVISMFIFKQ
ncbi:uncharacterized protein LOC589676 [Strongylocentrotus purpuratus]|uniref:Uncharacterized protein n=1 Tax=Strongylocentrotus purpuratus TaxID=7668 RepID=A0A7M7NBC6_STRPU|nr:uncharacterized protein LOC589676 [Strongylocentrotus purpuratus]